MAGFNFQEIGNFTTPTGVTCDNPTVIMDMNNNIQILGRFTITSYTNNMVIARNWPSFARLVNTDHNTRIPVCVGGQGTPLTMEIYCRTGEVHLFGTSATTSNLTVFTQGLNYNVSSEFYNPTYGNNTPIIVTD